MHRESLEHNRITGETISGQKLLHEIYPSHKKIDPRFLPKTLGGVFHYSPLDFVSRIDDPNSFYSVVRVGKKIVAIAALFDSRDAPDQIWVQSVCVDNAYQANGFSRQLLHEIFVFAKKRGKTLVLSDFTQEGAARLKHQFFRLSQEFSVPCVFPVD